MSEVIYVDFKNKKKLNTKITYNWTDFLTGEKYAYDSEMHNNEPHVKIELYITTGKGTSRIPQYCSIKSIDELKDELNKELK